ncbi:DNA topoisomerase 2 [Orobanche gracilis]
MIFGHLLTSSNYDDNVKKTTGGRNGYGAKLTNIFSTKFIIETADGKRLKKYVQVYEHQGSRNPWSAVKYLNLRRRYVGELPAASPWATPVKSLS